MKQTASIVRSPGKTIAIAGNIGTGKSSLVEFLTRTYGIEPFYEPNDENPYLPDFYQDMNRWAFHSQLYFLSNKFRMLQQLEHAPVRLVLFPGESHGIRQRPHQKRLFEEMMAWLDLSLFEEEPDADGSLKEGSLLAALMERGRVLHFELAKPSLHDIFVRIAKPEVDDRAVLRVEGGQETNHA